MKKITDAMQFIWDGMKKPDGKHIVFKQADVDYLYFNGFVNTDKFSLTDWQKAFVPFQKKEIFQLNKKQFLSLKPFRYVGPVNPVFDATKIRDGVWTKEELTKLYQRSISKVSTVPEDMFWHYVEELKKAGYVDPEGNLFINYGVKVGLRELIEQFSSPRHQREKIYSKTLNNPV